MKCTVQTLKALLDLENWTQNDFDVFEPKQTLPAIAIPMLCLFLLVTVGAGEAQEGAGTET